MRPSAIVLLLLLCAQFLTSESKLRQQAAVDDDDDDDEDWDEDDEDDEDDGYPKPEIDDDSRIYKNPRNSPSADCPRDEERAKLMGQKCLRKCSTDVDCKSKKKKCKCDGACGNSCIKPERECPALNEIEHGVMTITGKFFGDRAHYTCDTDYFMVGISERKCRGDGHWSGTTPSCKKDSNSFCSQPPKIQKAYHNAPSEQTTFDLDSTVQYFCNHGYNATGAKNAKCLMRSSEENIANWYGPDIVCKPLSCGQPPGIPNGWHSGECYTYDCRVTYHCSEEYELVGKAEKLCLADGTWTPKELPQCVQVTSVQCPKPENPVNGKAVYTSYAYNSIVSYECKYGYTVVGAATRRCGADRKWTGKPPTCQEINCGSPGVLYNGWIENIEDGTGLGASIIFRCMDHMKLEGNTSSICLQDGKWSYPLPQCLAPCVVPQIENGHVTIASHSKNGNHINNVTVVEHGEGLLVSCIPNYEFAANSTPVLCNNGTWSIVPSCTPARCKQMPKIPKNGMVIAPKTDHGMKAIFKCKDGYELVGGGPLNASKSVECQYGNWIGDIPHCIQLFCPFPGLIENGKVFLVGNMGVYDYRPYVRKIVNNKQIMYDCDKGYVLDDGPTGATCISGSWRPKELPKCIRGQHPRLRWSRRRRSADDNISLNYKKFIEFFRKVGKKLLHIEMTKNREHPKHKADAKLAASHQNNTNNASDSSVWKTHAGHGNKSRLREERMIDFLKMVYRKLQRMDAKQPNNSSNSTMHDLLNAMTKNFFHVDLAESRRNGNRSRSDFEIRNQREFIKLKREFERIMRFYNKSIRWNEKQNRKDAKRKGISYAEKRKDKKKHRKNYYKGFYEFVNSYVTEKLSMLEARNATEELIKKMNIDKFTVRNGTTFTVGEMYAFFKHIIENRLNSTDEDVTVASSTTTSAPTKTVEPRDNQSSTIPSNDVSVLDNEIPAKEGAPKHRSKRIRNASEDAGASRPTRKLLSVTSDDKNSKKSRPVDDVKSKQFTFDELQAQQQSRSKRFLPPSELDNQIILKNLYLNAYEDEYRANVKRSIDQANRTSDWFPSRRRKGNLGAYEIK